MFVSSNLAHAQRSSTQIRILSLSATTLSVKQMPSHTHGIPTWADGKYRKIFLNYTSDSNNTTTWLFTNSSGGSGSHTHSISNPSHNHSASSSKITLLPLARAFYYIMRLS